jgi:methyl-accepting chemotaxis protein
MNWFNNLTLKLKLVVGFGMTLVLMLAIGASGLWGSKAISRVAHQIMDVDDEVLKASLNVSASTLNLRRFEKDMFINIDNPEEVAKYLKLWQDMRQGLSKQLDTLDKLASHPTMKDSLIKIKDDLKTYYTGVEKIHANIKSGGIITTQDANKAMGEFKEAVHNIDTQVKVMTEYTEKKMEENKQFIEARDSAVTKIVLALICSAFALVILFTWFFIRNIINQLGGEPAYVNEIIHEVAQGNLTLDVKTQANDQSSMLFNIKGMVQTLRDIAGQSVEAANQVSIAADQIS